MSEFSELQTNTSLQGPSNPEQIQENLLIHKVREKTSKSGEPVDTKKVLDLKSYLFKNYETLNSSVELNSLLDDNKSNFFEIWQQVKNEKIFEKRYNSNKQKLDSIKGNFTPSAEDASYIAAQTGGDPAREELYTQAAFVMRASPEELTRAGLKPDEITNLRSAAESLGFRQTFSAETALSVSSFPGISTEQTQSAQSTLRATIPGDQLGKTTITREGTTLSYSDPENPSYAYRIDMATRPPRLTKSRNGLSISYEKQPDNPELEKIQGEVKSAESTFGKVRTEVSDSLQGAGLYSMNLDKYPIAEVQKLFTGTDFQSLQEEIGAAKTTDKQIEVQTKIRNLRAQTEGTLTKVGLQYMEYILAEKIEMNTMGIGNADEETVSQKDWQEKLKHLESLRESDQLTNYIEARQELETTEKKLAGIKSPGVGEFDRDATDTLDTLISLGYDELGQDALDRIIQAVNQKEKSSIGVIDSSLNTPLSREQKVALTLAIANIARNAKIDQKNPTNKDQATEKERQSWQGVDQTDRFIAYRQTQSGLWRETLQSLRLALQPSGTLHSKEGLKNAIYKPETLSESPNSSTP